jgi:hypothetical protein
MSRIGMSRHWSEISRDDVGSGNSDLYVWKPIARRERVKAAAYLFLFGTAFCTGVFALVGWRGGLAWGAVVQIVLLLSVMFAVVATGFYVHLTITGKPAHPSLDDGDEKS